MIDFSKYRVIELSVELCPTIFTLDGIRHDAFPSTDMDWNQTVEYSGGAKRLILRQIRYPDMDFNELVDMEAHLGTHAECGKHLDYDHQDIADYPVETWFGEACVMDFTDKKPTPDGDRYELKPKDFAKVKEGDIVLIKSSLPYNEAPTMTMEAAQYLIDKKVKQIGGLEPFSGVIGTGELRDVHHLFHRSHMVLLQGIVNLDKITKDRVMFFGFPMRIKGLDACNVRAVVLEEKD
ncbi:MAG: cyclase family protein [Candidatus Thermoplasmatota archaeon]|nr:cyclase family protein [Candidatus Thermoplasmatota archaeon]